MFAFWRRLAVPAVLVVVASGCWSQYRGRLGPQRRPGDRVGPRRPHRLGAGPGMGRRDGCAGRRAGHRVGRGGLRRLRRRHALGLRRGWRPGLLGDAQDLCAGVDHVVGDLLQSPPAVVDGIVYVQGLNAVYAFDATGTAGCGGDAEAVCAALAEHTRPATRAPRSRWRTGPSTSRGRTGSWRSMRPASPAAPGPRRSALPLWSGDPIAPAGDGSPAVVAGTVYVSDGTTSSPTTRAASTGAVASPRTCAPRWRASGTGRAPGGGRGSRVPRAAAHRPERGRCRRADRTAVGRRRSARRCGAPRVTATRVGVRAGRRRPRDRRRADRRLGVRLRRGRRRRVRW